MLARIFVNFYLEFSLTYQLFEHRIFGDTYDFLKNAIL